MAGKTATVLARVDPEVKKQAEDILEQLGIPASLMINMLYKQIVLTKGIPFRVALPSKIGELDIDKDTSAEIDV